MPVELARSEPYSGSRVVLDLVDIDAGMVSEVGGKAANLGELIRAGLPVPPGVCVTTVAYQAVAWAAPGLAELVDALCVTAADDLAALADLAGRARAALLSAAVPAAVATAVADGYERVGAGVAVAVRSSATAEDLPFASFAGQQDTYLNLVGRGAVLDAVRRCWASLWTDRAVAYRASNGIDHGSVRLGVVIQRMVQSAVSGVLFTANPVTGRRREAVIDASPGLGEAIVSGAVNPDHFPRGRRESQRRRRRPGRPLPGRYPPASRAAGPGRVPGRLRPPRRRRDRRGAAPVVRGPPARARRAHQLPAPGRPGRGTGRRLRRRGPPGRADGRNARRPGPGRTAPAHRPVVRTHLAAVGAELAAAGRIAATDDVFFLDLVQTRAALGGVDQRDLVAARRAAYEQEMRRRHVPRVLLSDGTEPERDLPAAAAAQGSLVGTPASAGTVAGPARVVLDPVGAHLEPGEILIAPSTDPGWTPLFLTAGGLVMEMGGANSHGAVVAREYGIPAVVGVPDATTRISTGQQITVDGSTGVIS